MSSETHGDKYPSDLLDVLKKYDEEAKKLKVNYENTLKESPDFDSLGFILSDYCTDALDGKQLTLSTYF